MVTSRPICSRNSEKIREWRGKGKLCLPATTGSFDVNHKAIGHLPILKLSHEIMWIFLEPKYYAKCDVSIILTRSVEIGLLHVNNTNYNVGYTDRPRAPYVTPAGSAAGLRLQRRL